MKKLLTICLLIATTFTVKAQEMEDVDGVWKFEKMKMHGIVVYFNDNPKDKENLINAYLKAVKNGLASDEEKEISIKGINENKSAIYASFKEQYGYNIEFKEDKLFYQFFNNDEKMEKKESKFYIENGILTIASSKYLYDIFDFKVLVKDGKLKLIENNEWLASEDDVLVFYFKK